MRSRFFSQALRRTCLLPVAALALVLVGIQARVAATAEAPPNDSAEFFFRADGAKDCVFDPTRQLLFVTNEKQLIVFDTKDRQTVKSIDLPGQVRACDITPDFKHVAVAPLEGQFFYWISLDDLEVSQVQFQADADETGVFDLCVGADGSVLFSMTFLNSRGSGWVKLRRFDPQTTAATEVGRVRMDTVVSASADRRFAALAEGNISSGPLKVFDFQDQTLRDITDTNDINYEIACSANARYFARPHRHGCDMYEADGTRLGNLSGEPVICAAFHPQADRVFVMHHRATSVQEYAVSTQQVVTEYPLDKALVITGQANDHIVANVFPAGGDAVIGHISRTRTVHFKTFQSGRVRMSDDGSKLFVVVPGGVHMFDTKTAATGETAPKFKVIKAK